MAVRRKPAMFWSARGRGTSFVKNGNAWLEHAGPLAGAVDVDAFTLVMSLRGDPSPANAVLHLAEDAEGRGSSIVSVDFGDESRRALRCGFTGWSEVQNASVQVVLIEALADTFLLNDGAFHRLYASADAASGAASMYFDDTDVLDAAGAIVDDGPNPGEDNAINLTALSQVTAGATKSGVNNLRGCVELIYAAFGPYTDFAQQANRDAFFEPDGRPKETLPGAPDLLFRGAPPGFLTNQGSGGAFTEAGTGRLGVCR